MSDESWATRELSQLPTAYHEATGDARAEQHREAAAKLTPDNPVVVLGDDLTDRNAVRITIVTRDAPGLFALVSGMLGCHGLEISDGHVFTSPGGLVIDQFSGRLAGDGPIAEWIQDLADALRALLAGVANDAEARSRARTEVAERVARTIAATSSASHDQHHQAPLLPIDIVIRDDGDLTAITVVSQDTPFFLYSLSTALALQEIVIRRLEIDTDGASLNDTFWVATRDGSRIAEGRTRNRLRMSILVTKQFSHALDQAADPRSAFTRFEEIVKRVALGGESEATRFEHFLADPDAQRELARLLGASDFLWKDFIRLQYEQLLPLLERSSGGELSTPSDELQSRLEQVLAAAGDVEQRIDALNEFKDNEAFLIDADHILRRNTDFFFLSHRLTRLAEVVVEHAFSLAAEPLVARYGTPRSAAGLGSQYAVFGLGKLGGSALGYASDIELMVVYSDHGDTDGDESIANREFYERLVREATTAIRAPREGIFRVDLRLRPYGDDGPRAVHTESFLTYFSAGGEAHSAERLALIRMRHVAGDAELGRRVTAIRDQIVYESDAIDVGEIRSLRQLQLDQKVDATRLNAKLSPGALVDLEYNVQLLQVGAGRDHPEVRDPGIHATLRGLSQLGQIDAIEAERMIRAYRFLRTLINALRMLRGNAQDLYLPAPDSLEYEHLARRVGYRDTDTITAAERLRIDFEVETASVRGFVERHLGQEALPGKPAGTPADLILADSMSDERVLQLLRDAGFANPSRATANLRRMAGDGEQREAFARLVVLSWEYLKRSPDPDMALNTWESFAAAVGDRSKFYRELAAQPRQLEIMLTIFAGSRFLAETLVREPANLTWISDPAVVQRSRSHEELTRALEATESEAAQQHPPSPTRQERLNALRRFRRREILRIGSRDICLGGEFETVVREISMLAQVVVDRALTAAYAELGADEQATVGPLAILAFGKLGGGELNYSSDIDLLAVYEPDSGQPEREAAAARLFKQVVRDLSDFTLEGQAYRVDLKLRPYGNAGRLVYSIPALLRYYEHEAELWEIQALIKLNPVAGDRELGRKLLDELWPVFSKRVSEAGPSQICETIAKLRTRAVNEIATSVEIDQVIGSDVKNGAGGIRDVEFLAQAMQMLHHSLYPQIVTGNTADGLRRLEEVGLLDATEAGELREDYLFLRRVEHFLQMYDDQQLHVVPGDTVVLGKLARVVLGEAKGSAEAVIERIAQARARVRERYRARVEGCG